MIDIGKLFIFNEHNMLPTDRLDIEKSLQLMSLKGDIDLKTLKKRYRYLVKKYHPDKHPHETEWYNQIVQQFNEAYSILLNYIPQKNSMERCTEETNTAFNGLSNQPFQTKTLLTIEEIEKECQVSDEYLENAVLVGWLQRSPRDNFAISMRDGISNTVRHLNNEKFQNLIENSRVINFFHTLFSVFLRATESGKMRRFPIAKNSTKFMRHFAIANSYLDRGIRYFYRYRHKGKIKNYKNVPISFLDDAIRLYSFMLPEAVDITVKRYIQARTELAELFQTRISEESLWNPWLE